MQILLTWLVSSLAVLVAAYLIPSVQVDGFFVALIVALVLGIVNGFLKPLLILLTMPLTIVTLGLFVFVINAALVMLTDYLVPGFESGGFWSSLIFSIVLTVINLFLNPFEK